VLPKLAAALSRADVVVLRAPVGSGKSLLARTIAEWRATEHQEQTTVCTPTNLLVDQYTQSFPEFATVGPRASHTAGAWRSAKSTFAAAPYRVLNYHAYLAHRAWSDVVVFDEAHRLPAMLVDFEALKVWDPPQLGTVAELAAWAHGQESLAKLNKVLSRNPDDYLLEYRTELWRGRPRPCLAVRPLTPRNAPPFLWPQRRVSKLLFMSATFHAEDLYDLGLAGRRIEVVDCDNPIPADRRRVVYDPVGNLSYAAQDRTLDALVQRIQTLAGRHATERGVVHTTYDLARKLRARLGADPRFWWHSADNARRVYREWREAPGAPVLVACGMAEGIDLPGDLCRWQVVTKVPYPSLADAAVLAKAQSRPQWFRWHAARDIQQAVGRSTRGADDWSVTYVVDSAFWPLFMDHPDLWPPGFRESVSVVGV
jgi:Rad3-related DNA helicase